MLTFILLPSKEFQVHCINFYEYDIFVNVLLSLIMTMTYLYDFEPALWSSNEKKVFNLVYLDNYDSKCRKQN